MRDIEIEDFDIEYPFPGSEVNFDGALEFHNYDAAISAAYVYNEHHIDAGLERPQLYIRIIQGDGVVDSIPIEPKDLV